MPVADLLRLCKALADDTRLRLVRLLLRGPLSVNEVTQVLGLGQSRVSRHLRILAESGLVVGRRQGTWMYYQASPAAAEPLVADAAAFVHRHERGVSAYTDDLARLEAVLERRRQRTRAFFDQVTDPDALQPLVDGDHCRQVALSLLRHGGARYVDLGTGAGLLLPALLECARQVVAVDASPAMLALARRTAGGAAARCDFRLGDLGHLPLADGEADGVVACMVLHHVSDPAGALAEAARVLAPGGQLAVVDLEQHHDERLREQAADLWLGFAVGDLEGWLHQAGVVVEQATVVTSPGRHPLIAIKGRKP